MGFIPGSETIKISSKRQVVMPFVFRERLIISKSNQLRVTRNEDGQLMLERFPSSLDWKELIAGMPVERVDIDSDGHYDSKKSPSFDEWMHDE
ncbi:MULTISPECIES: AbrB family transcriptional regulator [Levilactobacillus]|uniref:AbrB family transcriptional regulator n=1 Tax=Levilactobacillus TaxID=2767886 RepID=UPI001EF35A29|nr:AbrB family transcriptional regulator [Levilactobacillus sp. 244-2]